MALFDLLQVAISMGSVFAGWYDKWSMMMMKYTLNFEPTRLMRRTGKLYILTLVASALTILASVLAIFWNENSSAVHLWVDLIPQGFGMASFITSTLIVRVTESLPVCFI